MNKFSSKEVSDVFRNANFTLNYSRQLCESDCDIEAIEETLDFKGLKWEEVSPELLRKRFNAFSFFTEMAFFLFMPSVIVASIRDPLKAHLAVEDIIRTLPAPSSVHLREFYQRRWRMFSARQLTYLKEWLEFTEAPFCDYFDSHELIEAAKTFDQYSNIASDFENSKRV